MKITFTNTPEKTAQILIEENFSIEEYEKVQNRRKERMKSWEKHGVQGLIEREKQLIEFGEKVLDYMKKTK